MSLAQILEEGCQRYPDRLALIANDRRITYRQLNGATDALGSHLRSLGLQEGDPVAIMLPNSPDFVISYFAVLKIGAIAVTLNTMSTSHELRHLLGNCDARALITTATGARRYEDIRQDLPLCRHLILTDATGNGASFDRILQETPTNFRAYPAQGDEPAVMIYTAGLTGKPLGAVLTHRNLLTQSELLRQICHGTETDRGLAVIPLFHSFGAVANMLAVIRIGASVVLMERFTLDSIFAAIEQEKITYIAAVPRLFLGMIFHEGAAKYDVSSLRVCITGGSAIPPDVLKAFQDKFHVRLLEGYGLTEASPVCSFTRPDGIQKPGAVGTVIPEGEARVVDEGGRTLPPGQEGELLIRGPNVMAGYYKDAEATAQVIREGWLYTGDLARIDADGFIFLLGRKKRMIITSGFNVYPQEVEDILNLHPAVAASRVVSQPDLIRGEIVKAFVILREGMPADEKDIMRHCRIYLSSYKHPREITFVTTLE